MVLSVDRFMIAADTDLPRLFPWSVRIVLGVSLLGLGWFLWNKRPFVSDAEKMCQVTVLSRCQEIHRSVVSNERKIAWLERSMWSFGRLAPMPRGGGPGGGLARQVHAA